MASSKGGNNKDSAMAASLVKKGIHHGKRLTRPFANSGGLTMVMNAAGSSKAQRRGRR